MRDSGITPRRFFSACCGFENSGEAGDEASVDDIGLGELANRIGETAHLQWRDDDDGQCFGDRCPDEGMLEPTSGFDHNALETVTGEAPDERCDVLLVIGDAEQQVSFEQIDVECVLADIDADIDPRKLFGHGYSVLLNSGS